MKPLRIAVVGAGHMGTFHAQKVCTLAAREGSFELRGVADLLPGRAAAASVGPRARPVTDFRELLPEIEAAIVAVPTVDHFAVVEALLQARIDVLVEKPIAATLAEAEKLITLARERGCILQVGHLERFNAAIRTVSSAIHKPRFIEAHRLSPFPGRATDVDVVRDLMIHDLDLLQRLVEEVPSQVEAIGVPVVTRRVDIANARLCFPGGCVANVTASRVTPTPMRKIRLFQADGYFSIDLLEQEVTIAERGLAEPGGERQVELRRLSIDPDDALLQQLRAFGRACARRRVEAADGDDGLAALRLALRVIEAMPPLEGLP